MMNTIVPDASVVHASGIGQLQADPLVAGPRLSTWKPTRRAMATMGFIDLVVCDDQASSGTTCRRAGEARWPLSAHLREKEL